MQIGGRMTRLFCDDEIEAVEMMILPIKGKWFNMILSGDKQEEYREIKPYYTTRFKKIFEMYPNSNIPTGLDKQLIGFRLAGCRMYESHGIASIDKTPEPFRVTSKNHRTGEFTGRFSTHAQPDFQGTLYGGRSIMFEAKRTSKDRITRNVLTDTQMDVLEKHSRLGALCGVCICIQDDFFLYSVECMARYERNVRQAVPKAG